MTISIQENWKVSKVPRVHTVYQRTYRISSNTHPGVYFPQDSVDPVLKRDRLLNGTGVYKQLTYLSGIYKQCRRSVKIHRNSHQYYMVASGLKRTAVSVLEHKGVGTLRWTQRCQCWKKWCWRMAVLENNGVGTLLAAALQLQSWWVLRNVTERKYLYRYGFAMGISASRAF